METNKPANRIDAFFSTEYKKLLNYVRKNMAQRYAEASPEDIVQDVALSLLDKLNVDVQVENLAGYIYRSLRNKILDTQKKKRSTVSFEIFINRETEPLQENSLELEEQNYLNNYEPNQLLAAIEMLNNEDKYIINQTHFHGISFKELSNVMNIPIGTLLSRKHRAQVKLGKILEANRSN